MKKSLRFNQKIIGFVAIFFFLSWQTNAQLNSGLVGNYSFNAGNAVDEAEAKNGTAVGAVLTAGHEGNANTAYTFNGTSYISCDVSNTINNLKTAYSISAWFKRSAYASDLQVIVGKWTGSVAFDHFLLGVQNDRLVWATAGPGKNGVSSATAFSLDVWNHAVLTWESTGEHKLYLNGQLIQTTNLTGYTVNVSASNVHIGAQSSSFRRFIGDIDDVRIYNRVLVADEVSILTTLSMNKQDQTVAFDEITGVKEVGGPPFELSATATSSLPVNFTSSNTSAITISGTTATIAGNGVAYLSAVQGGDATYNGAIAVQRVPVKTAQTITFNALANKTALDPNFTLSATASSSLPVSFTSSNTSVAIVSGTTVDIIGAGNTLITASQAGNELYFSAAPVERELTVTKVDQTITFGSLIDREVASQNFTLTATATSTLPVSFSSNNLDVATVEGNIVTLRGPGTVTITASQVGNAIYNAAATVDQTFTVSIGNGLVAKYDFTGNGNDAVHGNNGTLSNVIASTDRFGNADAAYSFNGSNSIISCGNAAVVNQLTKSYTLSAWFKRTATTTDLEVIISKWGNAIASDHFLLGTQNSKFVFATAGPGKNGITSTASYPLNTWNHVVLTYENTGVHNLYLNNVLVGSVTLAAHTIAITNPVNLGIGAQAANNRVFTGLIDDVSIYSTALSADEISLLFNAASSRQDQTVTFAPIGEKKFGSADFELEATSSSSLAVSFRSSDTNVIAINGTTASLVGLGTAMITATQIGDANYNGNFAQQPVTVSKNDQTVDLSSYSTIVIADGSFNLPATTSAGLSISYSSGNTNILTLSGNVATPLSHGELTITATQAGNSFFNPMTLQQVVNVVRSNQVITFPALDTKQYGVEPLELTAASDAGLTITYASSNTAVATINGNVLSLVGVGTSTITASQTGNTLYNPALSVDQIVTVEKGDQAITFNAFDVVSYGAEAITLPTTTNAGQPITYISSNTEVATISGTVLSIVGIGESTITATQPGNDFYNPASTVEQVLTVSKGNQEILFDALEVATYGDPSIELPTTTTAGLIIDYTSSNSAVATISGTTLMIVAPGITTITAMQSGNDFYESAQIVEHQFTVEKADQEIVMQSFGMARYGDDVIELESVTSAGLSITYESSNTAVATVSGSVLTIVAPGTTMISASQAGNDFYKVASSEQELTVSKALQTITFDALPAKTFGDQPIALVAAASSALPVTFTSSNLAVATIVGTTLSMVGGGDVTITAIQSGNEFYESAVSIDRTLTVAKATQTITFSSIATVTMGDAPITLAASASSGLAVSYSASAENVAIQGNQLSFVLPGSITVSANQVGNESYEPAQEISHTFCINPTKPVITGNFADPSAPVLSSNASTGNQWFRNGLAISNAINANYLPVEAGVYTVQVTIGGCVSVLSEEFTLVITASEIAMKERSLLIYPNPSTDRAVIQLPNAVGTKHLTIYQADGKVIFATATDDQEVAVNTQNFAAGVSYVVVTTEEGKSFAGKLIKKF